MLLDVMWDSKAPRSNVQMSYGIVYSIGLIDLGFMMRRPKIKEKATLGDNLQNNSSASFGLLKMDPYSLGMFFHFSLFSFFRKKLPYIARRDCVVLGMNGQLTSSCTE